MVLLVLLLLVLLVVVLLLPPPSLLSPYRPRGTSPFGLGPGARTFPSYPSQFGVDTQPPAPLYICSGQPGMLEGRFPLLLHSFHSATLPRLSFHT